MSSMESNASYIKVAVIAGIITLILTVFVLIHYVQISKRPGTLVIPAGNTYLGPNAPNQNTQQPAPATTSNMFTAAADIPWHEVKGNIYPYVISVPTTLTLVAPKGSNAFDIYAIVWGGYDTNSTVLIGIDNLKNNPNTKAYISGPKFAYVNAWWHQFGGLKSVASIDEFTNGKGLKGYKAKYVNAAGETPNLDVFFEVPGHPEYMIHLASGILDPALFAQIIDRVSWEK